MLSQSYKSGHSSAGNSHSSNSPANHSPARIVPRSSSDNRYLRLARYPVPRMFYEIAPYLYLLVGLYQLQLQSYWLNGLAGSLLFFAGAIIYLLRSDYRRKDSVFNRKKTDSNWGELYELKPFLFAWLGILCVTWRETLPTFTLSSAVLWWQILGVLLCVYGLFLLLKRAIHRFV